ncbi:MAG: hypothetical protein AAF542_24660 [Pseudomonadota bacterium]
MVLPEDDSEKDLLVEKYVLNLLTAEEAENFEAAYLSDPKLIEEIETARHLHRGLKAIEYKLAEKSHSESKSSSGSLVNSIKSMFSAPVPSFALVLAAALGGLTHYFISFNDPQTQELKILSFDSSGTARKRGKSNTTPNQTPANEASFKIPLDENNLAVSVKIKEVLHDRYVVVVQSTDDIVSFESTTLKANNNRDIFVSLPSEKYVGRTFNIKVYGLNEDGTKSRVSFCHYSEACI